MQQQVRFDALGSRLAWLPKAVRFSTAFCWRPSSSYSPFPRLVGYQTVTAVKRCSLQAASFRLHLPSDVLALSNPQSCGHRNHDRCSRQFRTGHHVWPGSGLGGGDLPRPRYSGASLGFQVGAALSGGLTPILASALILWTGATWSISLDLIAAAIVTLAATIAARETARQPLD